MNLKNFRMDIFESLDEIKTDWLLDLAVVLYAFNRFLRIVIRKVSQLVKKAKAKVSQLIDKAKAEIRLSIATVRYIFSRHTLSRYLRLASIKLTARRPLV